MSIQTQIFTFKNEFSLTKIMSQEIGTQKFYNMSPEEAVTLYFVATGTGCRSSDFIKGQSEKIIYSRHKAWKGPHEW